MASARITRGLSGNSAFAKQVLNVVADEVIERLGPVRADAVQRTNAIVKAELVTDRSPDRRRHGAHLYGSFRCELEWDGQGFPITLRMRSNAPAAAVNAQESGARAHPMDGRMVFPVAARFGGKGAPAKRAIPRATAYKKNKAGTVTIKTDHVDHPGNRAIHMMQRGLDGAVEAAFGSVRR